MHVRKCVAYKVTANLCCNSAIICNVSKSPLSLQKQSSEQSDPEHVIKVKTKCMMELCPIRGCAFRN